MYTPVLFGLAVLLQLAAVAFAVGMVRRQVRSAPWIILAAAMILMLVFRVFGLMTGGTPPFLKLADQFVRLTSASISLCVSSLFLLSLFSIRHVILAREVSEAARRQSDEQLRLSLKSGQTGTWDSDIVNNRITWSDAIYVFHGLSPGEFGGRLEDFPPLIHPDDRERISEKVRQSIDNHTPYHAEYRALWPNGKIRWIFTTGEVIYDKHGKAIRMLGAASDITERKLAEEALQKSEARWQLAVRAARDGIWDWNLVTEELYWSPRCKEMLGYEDNELNVNGRDAVRNLMHPDDRDRGLANAMRHLRGEVPVYQDEYRVLHRDGSYRWILSRGQAIFDSSGRAVRMTGSNTDVTERRRLEVEREELLSRERETRVEAERANKAKDEFIAILSHELRTPLTPILLTVSLMESHPQLPDDLRADVANIRRNIELESRLIGDLLDLTRISQGKLQLDMYAVDLHPLLRSTIAICLREDSVQMQLDLSATHHFVRGDGTRLQQVFWNLINNAQKFTPPNGTITLRTSDVQEGGIVRVEVSDSGEGIDPVVLPKLFNAFEQGEVRATRQFAGLGLGLAICKRLVEAQGGTIAAISEGRGKGATFVVELPTIPKPIPSQPSPDTMPLSAPTRPMSVLLVEDHEPTARVLAKLLRNLGHDVKTVYSVASALGATNVQRFDLLLSDIGLPDGSGLDLMRQLRDQYAGKAIALTGFGMEEDIRSTRAAGFAAHVTKPVDFQRLRETIDQFAGGNGTSAD
ncbi:MAG TPA: PAS domain-containing protein [Tepidisphaeraceae bacterium]|jgi:PAS domain S-box-containing protein